jgi:hypothetical protein
MKCGLLVDPLTRAKKEKGSENPMTDKSGDFI